MLDHIVRFYCLKLCAWAVPGMSSSSPLLVQKDLCLWHAFMNALVTVARQLLHYSTWFSITHTTMHFTTAYRCWELYPRGCCKLEAFFPGFLNRTKDRFSTAQISHSLRGYRYLPITVTPSNNCTIITHIHTCGVCRRTAQEHSPENSTSGERLFKHLSSLSS